MDLSKYYDEIMKEPLLTEGEEKDLFLEYQDAGISETRRSQIRDRIIRANLRFVFKTAKSASKKDPTMFEDLIAAGNEGLLVGFEKFKPDEGYRFLTYAGWWVKQRILHQMSTQRLVALPIWRQQLAARIQKAVDSNENITLDELRALFPEVKDKDLKELFDTSFLTFYIEDIGDDPAFEIDPIETSVNAKLDQQKIHAALSSLSEQERTLLDLLYGITDGEEMKPADIMIELKLTKEQFRTIKRDALAKLKAIFGDTNPFA